MEVLRVAVLPMPVAATMEAAVIMGAGIVIIPAITMPVDLGSKVATTIEREAEELHFAHILLVVEIDMKMELGTRCCGRRTSQSLIRVNLRKICF